MKERRLGLGLDALIGLNRAEADGAPSSSQVSIDEIRPNPFQPRTEFDPAEIEALAQSIKSMGVLQPVVVRLHKGIYELVAGERRLRAAKLAGLSTIPVVVRPLDDHAMLKYALVENVQRKDLNPIEKAHAFKALTTGFKMTQEQISSELGLDRATVSNFVRLLELPAEIQAAVSRGLITQGHARALLACKTSAEQAKLLKKTVSEELSVRELEKLIYGQPARPKAGRRALSPHLADIEQKLGEALATKVRLKPRRKGGGEIVVDYFTDDQLTQILQILNISV
jgi:ParB family chromosome partitioning protein